MTRRRGGRLGDCHAVKRAPRETGRARARVTQRATCESRRPSSPPIYLAHVPGAQGDNSLKGQRGVRGLPAESLPALLISFVYLKPFLAAQKHYRYREWALDSRWWGAVDSSAVTGVVRLRIGHPDELGTKKDKPHRGPATWMTGVPVD